MFSIPAPLPKTAQAAPTPARPVATRAPSPSRFDLETVNGTIYHGVVVERVETNAIVISYVPANGGTAMLRVYFDELPFDVREQYETARR